MFINNFANLRFQMLDLLPDLVIINILKYLPLEDLILRIPKVSQKWSLLSSSASLWNNIVFRVPDGTKDSQILETIQKAPFLRHFRLDHAEDLNLIIDNLIFNCKDIRTIRLKWKKGPSWPRIPKLLVNCDRLECLECYVPEKYVTIDYMKYLGRLDDGKCFIVTDSSTQLEFRSYGRNITERTISMPISHVEKFLMEHRQLRNIAIGQNITSKVVGQLYKYNNLKSLFVHSNCSEQVRFNIAKLCSISTLENLHLIINHRSFVVEFNPARPVRFERLTKLELLSLKTHLRIGGLLSFCNNLEFLTIMSKGMTDSDLNGLEECTNLKHLDLSYNQPGFGNDTLSRIGRSCQELVFLDLTYPACEVFYEYNLLLLKPCTKIRYLRLSYQLTPRAMLNSIPNTFTNLVEIFFNNPYGFGKKELAILQRFNDRLRVRLTEDDVEDYF